jgi:hypothetical protein
MSLLRKRNGKEDALQEVERTSFQKIVPFTKIDASLREVYGVVTAEVPDKEDEVCDYATTKPYYKAWSDGLLKASGGLNCGNLREMHRLEAVGAGKLIEFRDDAKQVYMGFRVVDDNAWKKVKEGVLVGFSHGGAYIKTWKGDDGYTHYTARPTEVSLVDNPALNSAVFELVRADGRTEMMKAEDLAEVRLSKEKKEKNEGIPAEEKSEKASMDELAKAKSIQAVIGRLKGETKTAVQSVIFSPKESWSKDECSTWLKDHDLVNQGVDETGSSFRYRQKDPGDFQDKSFRTIAFKGGSKVMDQKELDKLYEESTLEIAKAASKATIEQLLASGLLKTLPPKEEEKPEDAKKETDKSEAPVEKKETVEEEPKPAVPAEKPDAEADAKAPETAEEETAEGDEEEEEEVTKAVSEAVAKSIVDHGISDSDSKQLIGVLCSLAKLQRAKGVSLEKIKSNFSEVAESFLGLSKVEVSKSTTAADEAGNNGGLNMSEKTADLEKAAKAVMDGLTLEKAASAIQHLGAMHKAHAAFHEKCMKLHDARKVEHAQHMSKLHKILGTEEADKFGEKDLAGSEPEPINPESGATPSLLRTETVDETALLKMVDKAVYGVLSTIFPNKVAEVEEEQVVKTDTGIGDRDSIIIKGGGPSIRVMPVRKQDDTITPSAAPVVTEPVDVVKAVGGDPTEVLKMMKSVTPTEVPLTLQGVIGGMRR